MCQRNLRPGIRGPSEVMTWNPSPTKAKKKARPRKRGADENQRGHTRLKPPAALPSSISPRLRDILARSRMTSRKGRGDDGGSESSDPPLHVLSEDKYGEVVLERL